MNARRFYIIWAVLTLSLWGATSLGAASYPPLPYIRTENSPTAIQAITLKNDSYVPGGTVGFKSGFVAGEISAARLTPSGPGPVQITSVLVLLGGASVPTTATITLNIWNDDQATTEPGALVYTGQHLLTLNDSLLQEIDLTASHVMVEDTFRVGIEYTWNGLPSTGYDSDGLVPEVNFVYLADEWHQASDPFFSGDWIIRAVVESSYKSLFLPLVVK